MAGKCKMQEKLNELSRLLQNEKDLRVREQQRATQREKALRAEMHSMKESITNQNIIKVKALERERNSLLKEVQSLKTHTPTISVITDECQGKTAEMESIRKQTDDLQKEVEELKLQLRREKDQHIETQSRDSEREKVLRKEISDLKKQLQREWDECEASFTPKFKAWERQNKALITQVEKLRMSLTQEDLSKKDAVESTEKVTVTYQDSSAQTELEVCAQVVPRNFTTEGEQALCAEIEQLKLQLSEEQDLRAKRQQRDFERVNFLYKEICHLKVKFQWERTECGDTKVSELKAVELLCDLGEQLQKEQNECAASFLPKIDLLEKENGIFITQLEQLKMSCRENNLALQDLSKKDEAESAEEVTVAHQEDATQEPETSAEKVTVAHQEDATQEPETSAEKVTVAHQEDATQEPETSAENVTVAHQQAATQEPGTSAENVTVAHQQDATQEPETSAEKVTVAHQQAATQEPETSAENVTVAHQQDATQEPGTSAEKVTVAHQQDATQEPGTSAEKVTVAHQEDATQEPGTSAENVTVAHQQEATQEPGTSVEKVTVAHQQEATQEPGTSAEKVTVAHQQDATQEPGTSVEKVTVAHQQEATQEPGTSAQKVNEACGEEPLKNSEEEQVPEQETSDLVKKLQTDVLQNLDTLAALDKQSKFLSNYLNQLKISFDCVAEKYRAERTENKTLQNVIEDLNIKLQKEIDLTKQLQLENTEREKTMGKEIADLQELLQKEREHDGKRQAFEKEKAAYLHEIEELNLICEGKALRIKGLLEKIKEEKAHKEAIKDEQFQRIRALNNKVRQLQDSNAQQKLRASERENFLSLKVQELEQIISDYEKRAHSKVNPSSSSDDEQPGCSKDMRKTKKRKGWKKFAHYTKPWNWGKK